MRLALPMIATLLFAAGCAVDEESRRVRTALTEHAAHLQSHQQLELSRRIVRIGRDSDVPPLLLVALIEQESEFRPEARGPRGALGLMQLRPATAREVAGKIGVRLDEDEQLHTPELNLRLGAAYLASLYERFGNWEAALTAYNLGPTRTRRMRKPTSPYAREVLARHAALAG